MSRSKRPNFLLIVVDDMGYSDCEPFGGEVRTPNLMRLAEEGVRFRHFYTSSLCAPTRSLLLTGVDNHLNGLGVMPPMHSTNQFMQPGYEGTLNGKVATIAELLGDAGYFTCISGKWHLGKNAGQRPEDRGFQRVFSFLGGGASHFSDARALAPSEQPHTLYDDDGKDVTHTLPDDFYSTTYYTGKLIEFIAARPADKPFFGYLAYTAPHDPLQVPDDSTSAVLSRSLRPPQHAANPHAARLPRARHGWSGAPQPRRRSMAGTVAHPTRQSSLRRLIGQGSTGCVNDGGERRSTGAAELRRGACLTSMSNRQMIERATASATGNRVDVVRRLTCQSQPRPSTRRPEPALPLRAIATP